VSIASSGNALTMSRRHEHLCCDWSARGLLKHIVSIACRSAGKRHVCLRLAMYHGELRVCRRQELERTCRVAYG
jgi:hypothetical protein